MLAFRIKYILIPKPFLLRGIELRNMSIMFGKIWNFPCIESPTKRKGLHKTKHLIHETKRLIHKTNQLIHETKQLIRLVDFVVLDDRHIKRVYKSILHYLNPVLGVLKIFKK